MLIHAPFPMNSDTTTTDERPTKSPRRIQPQEMDATSLIHNPWLRSQIYKLDVNKVEYIRRAFLIASSYQPNLEYPFSDLNNPQVLILMIIKKNEQFQYHHDFLK